MFCIQCIVESGKDLRLVREGIGANPGGFADLARATTVVNGNALCALHGDEQWRNR